MRILVIGLDGATWDIVDPWAKENLLPTIKEIMEKGVSSELNSTIPSYTIPAWTSLVTGVNPGKHGLFDVFKEEGKEKRVVSSKDRKVESIFEILSAYGKKSVAVNIPATFPPDKIDGAMVSGMLTPGKKSNFVHPPQFKKKLLPLFEPSFKFDFKIARYYSNSDKKKLVELANKVAQSEIQATLWLMEKIKPDFVWHTIRTTDIVQHYLYDFDIEKISGENNQKKKSYIYLLNHYKKIDSLIKQLIDAMNNPDLILIVSDHGFAPLKKYVYLNSWLENLDLLKKNKKHIKKLDKLSSLNTKVQKVLRLPGFKLIAGKILEMKLWKGILANTSRPIDLDNSQAYCPSYTSQAIRIIDRKNTVRIREKIKKEALKIKDPATGENVIEEALLKEEIYSGNAVEKAPDLVFSFKEGYICTSALSKKNEVVAKPPAFLGQKTGDHRPDGIFIASGKLLSNRTRLHSPPHIYDITPTLLSCFQVPVPKIVDGKVLTEITETVPQKPKLRDERKTVKKKIEELKNIGKL